MSQGLPLESYTAEEASIPSATPAAPTLLYLVPTSQNPEPGLQLHAPSLTLATLTPAKGPKLAGADSLPFGPPDLDYSLLEDVKQAMAASVGPKERICLHGFPAYVTTNVRRVLSRAKNGRVDWAAAMSCLLWHGLTRYAGLAATQTLAAGLGALDTDDDLGTLAGEQVEMWRKGFRFSVADPTHTMGLERSRAWKVPDFIHTELFELAGKVGIGGGTLGIVSVMAGLMEQPGVLVDHAAFMRGTVNELDGLLRERGRRLNGLVRAIEAGVWT